jgi:predicted ribonuclease YlaK
MFFASYSFSSVLLELIERGLLQIEPLTYIRGAVRQMSF